MQSTPEQLAKRLDPLLSNVDLPLSALHYPLGFPLRLITNSRDVVESAQESWGLWTAEFERPPLTIRVIVRPEGLLAPPPTFRRQGHLFSIVSDADNFAIADLRLLEGCIFVSDQTAKDHAWLRWYFVEALGYLLLAQRDTVPVHAACVAREGSGILLCGASGAGKSTLSFACARAGWTFVSDDATSLLPDSDSAAIGRPHRARFRPDAPRWFAELERFAERVRPNGKLSLEVPLAEFPEIRTTHRCTVGALVALERGTGARAALEPADSAEIAGQLLQDSTSYGEDGDRIREQTVRKLSRLPAYRLNYSGLEDAVALLSRVYR